MDDKIDILKKVTLFSQLTEQELHVVAGSSGYRKFSKGEIIFQEGSFAQQLYVVKEGEVMITKQGEDREELSLARFIGGECFGELDLFENAPRAASARAETDAVLLEFPAQGLPFEKILSGQPLVSARILHKLLALIAGRLRSTNRLISEKSKWVQDLRHQILTDKLTGLYNRTYIEEELDKQLPEFGSSTSMLIIKPDNFKIINDTYGHDAGDKVLKLMAATIRNLLREKDVAVRYRGDEFAGILPDTGAAEASGVAEVLRKGMLAMDTAAIVINGTLTVTVSIGIAAAPGHAKDAKALTEKAFACMMEARNQGGDRIRSAG